MIEEYNTLVYKYNSSLYEIYHLKKKIYEFTKEKENEFHDIQTGIINKDLLLNQMENEIRELKESICNKDLLFNQKENELFSHNQKVKYSICLPYSLDLLCKVVSF
jgi:hypothetical protein